MFRREPDPPERDQRERGGGLQGARRQPGVDETELYRGESDFCGSRRVRILSSCLWLESLYFKCLFEIRKEVASGPRKENPFLSRIDYKFLFF